MTDPDTQPQGLDAPLLARAAKGVARLARRLRVRLDLSAASTSRWVVRFEDAAGSYLFVFLERRRPGAQYYRHNAALGLWYKCNVSAPVEPQWIATALQGLAHWLLAPSFVGIAAELSDGESSATGEFTAVADEGARFSRFSVLDLVRRGLKPAASLLISDPDAVAKMTAGLPAVSLSRFGFRRDGLDNLVFVADPGSDDVGVQRMLYAARSQDQADRLQDIESALYGASAQSPAAKAALQEEFGVALGFPACCARAFAQRTSLNRDRAHGDFYESLRTLGWHLRLVDWRVNHVVARQYELPFLIHEPCSATCQPTRDTVERTIRSLYDEAQRVAIEAVLSQGAIVDPHDRIILFRLQHIGDANEELAVEGFNHDLHPQILGHPRPAARRVDSDTCGDVADADVEGIRIRGDSLEVFGGGKWQRFGLPGGSKEPAPLLLVIGQPQPRAGDEPFTTKRA